MEIVSYVLAGALEHKDSLGTGSVIRPGDVQRMSAGTGVRHSEYNHSKDEPVHFLQVWISPERQGLEPGYEQKHFSDGEKRGRLRLIAARDGAGGSVTINADARVYAALREPGQRVAHALGEDRHACIHVTLRDVMLHGQRRGHVHVAGQ